MKPPEKSGPLGMATLALLLDRRRRIVRPDRVLPLVDEMLRGLVWMFDACHSATGDPSWSEAMEQLERARAVVREGVDAPARLEEVGSSQFVAAARGAFRKPMAMVKNALPGFRRRTFGK